MFKYPSRTLSTSFNLLLQTPIATTSSHSPLQHHSLNHKVQHPSHAQDSTTQAEGVGKSKKDIFLTCKARELHKNIPHSILGSMLLPVPCFGCAKNLGFQHQMTWQSSSSGFSGTWIRSGLTHRWTQQSWWELTLSTSNWTILIGQSPNQQSYTWTTSSGNSNILTFWKLPKFHS